MKKKLLLAGLALFIVTGFTACTKEDELRPLRGRMLGRWVVNSVKTEVGGSDPSSQTITYTSNSFMEFKDNRDDDVELTLNNNRNIGSFISRIDDSFLLSLTNKELECKTINITENRFEFVGTRVNSNPKVTETYILSR